MFCCFIAVVCDQKTLFLCCTLYIWFGFFAFLNCTFVRAKLLQFHKVKSTLDHLHSWEGVNHSTLRLLVKGHITYTVHMPERITSRNRTFMLFQRLTTFSTKVCSTLWKEMSWRGQTLSSSFSEVVRFKGNPDLSGLKDDFIGITSCVLCNFEHVWTRKPKVTAK